MKKTGKDRGGPDGCEYRGWNVCGSLDLISSLIYLLRVSLNEWRQIFLPKIGASVVLRCTSIINIIFLRYMWREEAPIHGIHCWIELIIAHGFLWRKRSLNVEVLSWAGKHNTFLSVYTCFVLTVYIYEICD